MRALFDVSVRQKTPNSSGLFMLRSAMALARSWSFGLLAKISTNLSGGSRGSILNPVSSFMYLRISSAVPKFTYSGCSSWSSSKTSRWLNLTLQSVKHAADQEESICIRQPEPDDPTVASATEYQ